MENENIGDLNNTFNRVIQGAQNMGNFKVTPGKKVYELRPDIDWDKGKAINLLIEKYGRRNGRKNSLLPVYLGDDMTDEDGFEAIKRHGNGISVHIGNNLRRTNANYFLKSPDEVIDFLEKLLGGLRRGFK